MLGLKDLCVLISCGLLLIVQSSHGSEIIGGKEVKERTMRYMALLRAKEPVCGGILIHQKWVLTAAHCDKIEEVWLGVHTISNKKKWQVRKVKKPFPHPHFNKDTKVNDLMLLKLKRPVKKTKKVEWLELGETIKDPAAGSSCLVAGWGDTRPTFKEAEMSVVLMSVNVTVISRKDCNSDKHYKGIHVITSDMICAGSNGDKKVGVCKGDSGGPIMCDSQLVGVTSFGSSEVKKRGGVKVHKCGEKKQVGVYTFLSEKHLEWIKKTMGKSEIE